MRDLGLDVTIDAIGNVFATRQGSDPSLAPVMTGSHIDTVRTGGRFDGNLGVLGGLEVIETLIRHDVTTERGVTVAFFTDEEGARFAPDMLGSLVHVGGLPLEEALDIRAADDGARVGDELQRIGYAGPMPCPAAAFPHAYVELHIEQGPILEDEGIEIGVVEGVQGISWTEVTLTGQSAHAGTTPMRLRRDPGVVAAQVVTFVRELTRELGGDQVATVGRIELHPNLVNVVPATVTMTVDLRNTDEATLQVAERRFVDRAGPPRGGRGCHVHHPAARPVRAGRVRPVDDRPRRIVRGDAGLHDPPHAERRRPRRADARPRVPDVDDLRPLGQRPQPQPRRVHRPRRPRARRQRPAPRPPRPSRCERSWVIDPGSLTRPRVSDPGDMAHDRSHHLEVVGVIAQFDLVTLDVADPARQSAFWRAALDLIETEVEDVDRWIVLSSRDLVRRIGLQRGAPRQGTVHLDLVCSLDAFDREIVRLDGLGASVRSAPRREPYGSIVNLADPEGNLFDLCAYAH